MLRTLKGKDLSKETYVLRGIQWDISAWENGVERKTIHKGSMRSLVLEKEGSYRGTKHCVKSYQPR
jgi:hypothetical protein